MAVAPVTSNLIETGPGRLRWAIQGTTIPTVTAVASKVVATWTTWNDAGSTDGGITYTESVDTADVSVAESLYPVRTVVTSKTSRIAGTLNEISDLNWAVVMNGGTITVTGATTTKLSEYAPPLVGAERRIMLAFQNNLDTEIIVWPAVFNVGSVEYVRGTYDTKAGLSFEFNAEIPSGVAGYAAPYKRFVAGALALSP